MQRQEALLRVVPRWPHVATFRDPLTARQRRAHSPASLTSRAELLHLTVRRDTGTIWVASLAVLAWSDEDLRGVLAASRKGVLVAIAEDLTVPAGPIDADAVVATWRAARARAQLEGQQLQGATVSAKRRRADSDAAIERIRDRWPLSSSEWSTAALLAEAGLSRNTVNARLGGRELAQKRHQAADRRKARKDG